MGTSRGGATVFIDEGNIEVIDPENSLRTTWQISYASEDQQERRD
jgi:hypothetical protein